MKYNYKVINIAFCFSFCCNAPVMRAIFLHLKFNCNIRTLNDVNPDEAEIFHDYKNIILLLKRPKHKNNLHNLIRQNKVCGHTSSNRAPDRVLRPCKFLRVFFSIVLIVNGLLAVACFVLFK